MNEENIDVLLIDDDVELCALLRDYLNLEGFNVTCCHDGESGIAEAATGRYSMLVLDVMLPGISGVEVLQRVRARSRLPVLMLTARGDDEDRIAGLELGADDYVAKPCLPRELVARVRAILRRTGVIGDNKDRGPVEVGPLRMLPERRLATWDGEPLDLTGAEFNILEILARNAGRTVPKGELCMQALGRPLDRYDRAIDVHMSSIRHKLDRFPQGRTHIQTVRGFGYQLVQD